MKTVQNNISVSKNVCATFFVILMAAVQRTIRKRRNSRKPLYLHERGYAKKPIDLFSALPYF